MRTNDTQRMGQASQRKWGYEESISCPFEAFSNAVFAFSYCLASLNPLATAEKNDFL